MKRLILTASLLTLASVPLATLAQDEGDEAEPQYVMATYYYCEQDEEADADEAFAKGYAPVLAAAVEAGTIENWGWMAHRLGGKWRRVWVFGATGAGNLMDAADKIYADLTEAIGDEDPLTDACPTHDDYLWETGGGNASDERGATSFSVYYDCDSSREARADEIVNASLAPVMNDLIKNGNIASWGWLKHHVGGKYRRLLTLTGASHKATLQARDHVVDVVYAEGNEAGAEFDGICSKHSDYMWDNQLPTG